MESRRFVVSRAEGGQAVAEVVRLRLDLPRPAARRLVRDGRVTVQGTAWTDPARPVAPGQKVEVRHEDGPRAQVAGPAVAGKPGGPTMVYMDDDIVVVDKPPGLTTMRHAEEAAEFGERARYLPSTMADLLGPRLGRGPDGRVRRPLAVHRLDKETSGLVVFALNPEAASRLGQQFRDHTIERKYLALVRGQAQDGRIESRLVRDRGDGRRGSRPGLKEGRQAVTHVRVVERLGDFGLVECRLETGRTHQVRIHLGESGTPLCGERLYDRPVHGAARPDTSGAGRVMLHAETLGFDHPRTGKRMTFHSPPPQDMADLLATLRLWAGGPRSG